MPNTPIEAGDGGGLGHDHVGAHRGEIAARRRDVAHRHDHRLAGRAGARRRRRRWHRPRDRCRRANRCAARSPCTSLARGRLVERVDHVLGRGHAVVVEQAAARREPDMIAPVTRTRAIDVAARLAAACRRWHSPRASTSSRLVPARCRDLVHRIGAIAELVDQAFLPRASRRRRAPRRSAGAAWPARSCARAPRRSMNWP